MNTIICTNLIDVLLGLSMVLLFGLLSLSKRAVDFAGLVAGIVVGSTYVFVGGLMAFIPLLTFFLLASIFTKYKYSIKMKKGAAEKRQGARSWNNVVSNGLPPFIFLVLWKIFSSQAFLLAFLSAIAADLSDTLSNEIGTLSHTDPILLFSWKRVPAGTSGAVSVKGTLAGLIAPIIISIEAIPFLGLNWYLLIPIFAGFMGNLMDSVLGATLEAKYRCPICDKMIEEKYHCGVPAELVKGVSFVNNDVVNASISVFAGILGIVLYYFI